ncbi:MAG: hypothetical protein M3Z66_07640 [Chloroflexota bacterium]|nr:hypothetical protein [Chloroflexota bacterium]
MSLFDALLGRDKPLKSKLDNLFGLSTAELTLATEFDLTPTNAAAVSFRRVSSGEFARLETEINDLLQASTKDSPLQWHSYTDNFGYQWIIVQAEEFSNLVATMHMISLELQDGGYGEQLLASVFQYRSVRTGQNVYWIYNYKRGTFYPFVPTGKQDRDNAFEMRLNAIMSLELECERDLTKWYALWGIPLT